MGNEGLLIFILFPYVLAFFHAILVLIIAGMWKIFTKAGQPGWAAIIPIYNTYILLKIVKKPVWWLLILLIPLVGIPAMLVGIIPLIIVTHNLSRRFHKGTGFTLGLITLPFIFYPILGFGDAVYDNS